MDELRASLAHAIEQQAATQLLVPEHSPHGPICKSLAAKQQLPVHTLERDLPALSALIANNPDLALTLERPTPFLPEGNKVIVAWASHQEIDGDHPCSVGQAFQVLAEEPTISIVFPVRKDMAVQQLIYQSIDWHENIHLLEPLDYLAFIHLLSRADLVVTNSPAVASEAEELSLPLLFLSAGDDPSSGAVEKRARQLLATH